MRSLAALALLLLLSATSTDTRALKNGATAGNKIWRDHAASLSDSHSAPKRSLLSSADAPRPLQVNNAPRPIKANDAPRPLQANNVTNGTEAGVAQEATFDPACLGFADVPVQPLSTSILAGIAGLLDANFSAISNLETVDDVVDEILFADVTGDGLADFVVAGHRTVRTSIPSTSPNRVEDVRVLLFVVYLVNDGNGDFLDIQMIWHNSYMLEELRENTTPVFWCALAVGDFDNNTVTDVAAAHCTECSSCSVGFAVYTFLRDEDGDVEAHEVEQARLPSEDVITGVSLYALPVPHGPTRDPERGPPIRGTHLLVSFEDEWRKNQISWYVTETGGENPAFLATRFEQDIDVDSPADDNIVIVPIDGNNDGQIDFVVADEDGRLFYFNSIFVVEDAIRLNDTELSYAERDFDAPRVLLDANFTASAFPDLVVLSYLSIGVYLNSGSGLLEDTFEFSQSFAASRGSTFVTMAVTDVDKDGADDVMFVEQTSGGSLLVSYLVNDGSGRGRFSRLPNSRALPSGAFAEQLVEDRSVSVLEVAGEEVLLLNAERWDRIEWLVREPCNYPLANSTDRGPEGSSTVIVIVAIAVPILCISLCFAYADCWWVAEARQRRNHSRAAMVAVKNSDSDTCTGSVVVVAIAVPILLISLCCSYAYYWWRKRTSGGTAFALPSWPRKTPTPTPAPPTRLSQSQQAVPSAFVAKAKTLTKTKPKFVVAPVRNNETSRSRDTTITVLGGEIINYTDDLDREDSLENTARLSEARERSSMQRRSRIEMEPRPPRVSDSDDEKREQEYDTDEETNAYDCVEDLVGSDSEPDVDFLENPQARGAVGTPFTCKVCGETLIGLAKFRAHMLAVHNDKEQRVFSCDTCGKSFERKWVLQQHMLTHREVTVNPPLSCPVCNKGFRQSSNLKRHIHRVHDMPHKCRKCVLRFRVVTELHAHHAESGHGPKNAAAAVKGEHADGGAWTVLAPDADDEQKQMANGVGVGAARKNTKAKKATTPRARTSEPGPQPPVRRKKLALQDARPRTKSSYSSSVSSQQRSLHRRSFGVEIPRNQVFPSVKIQSPAELAIHGFNAAPASPLPECVSSPGYSPNTLSSASSMGANTLPAGSTMGANTLPGGSTMGANTLPAASPMGANTLPSISSMGIALDQMSISVPSRPSRHKRSPALAHPEQAGHRLSANLDFSTLPNSSFQTPALPNSAYAMPGDFNFNPGISSAAFAMPTNPILSNVHAPNSSFEVPAPRSAPNQDMASPPPPVVTNQDLYSPRNMSFSKSPEGAPPRVATDSPSNSMSRRMSLPQYPSVGDLSLNGERERRNSHSLSIDRDQQHARIASWQSGGSADLQRKHRNKASWQSVSNENLHKHGRMTSWPEGQDVVIDQDSTLLQIQEYSAGAMTESGGGGLIDEDLSDLVQTLDASQQRS